MNLYIPGLNLPRANQELWIAIQSDGSFRYNSCGWHDSQQKAIAVQSHGRLGDLSELEAIMREGYEDLCQHPLTENKDINNAIQLGFCMASGRVFLAETVAPAEEEP